MVNTGHFKKGHDPRRSVGGPRKPTWETLKREVLELYGDALSWQHPEYGEVSDPDHMAMIQFISAIQNGESWAVKDAMDRKLGKPTQAVELAADIDLTNFDASTLTDDLLATIIAGTAAVGAGEDAKPCGEGTPDPAQVAHQTS